MSQPIEHIPIVIVGGGPVGLFLALSLLKNEIPCRVLEHRTEPVPDSRSLGIHPVSLELFDELDITPPFLEAGLKIRKGYAFSADKKMGEISFESGPGPHPYILACPQFKTEQILRDELNHIDKGALITGAEYKHYTESADDVTVHYNRNGEGEQTLKCQFLIGCDGKNSLVRQQADIGYTGKRYEDTYVMGDFKDTTGFGADAAVFLPKQGMIECFPLPNGMRRWVVKTDEYQPEVTATYLAELVSDRIAYDLHGVESTMLSSFGVQHFLSDTFNRGRILLAGDAAHVVSPIGGQGMNLGWIGAWELSHCISHAIKEELEHSQFRELFEKHNKFHGKRTRQVAKRAELNMSLGRKQSFTLFRNIVIRAMLSPFFSRKTAALFTMRKLKPILSKQELRV